VTNFTKKNRKISLKFKIKHLRFLQFLKNLKKLRCFSDQFFTSDAAIGLVSFSDYSQHSVAVHRTNIGPKFQVSVAYAGGCYGLLCGFLVDKRLGVR